MSYTTTKVKALKSYPTYQFYAKADSRTLDSSNVFKVCILETLRWIRARLEGHSELPQELSTPEPERYADFGDDMLISFSYNSGFQIDVIYIDKEAILQSILPTVKIDRYVKQYIKALDFMIKEYR